MCGIYLDYQSASPLDPRVHEFAERYLSSDFGNPSALHSRGLAARAALEEARAKVAELINAESPESIVFTAGVTEANNLAIRGAAQRNAVKGKKLLASSIEHISVINPLKDLKKGGFDLSSVPVDSMGSIDLAALEGQLTMDAMFNIQVSTGSACSSRTLEPSHVLLAIGLKHEEAHGSMVMTLGRQNDPDQIPAIANAAKKTVERLRALSPL